METSRIEATPESRAFPLLTRSQRTALWLLRRRSLLYLCCSVATTVLVVIPPALSSLGWAAPVLLPYVFLTSAFVSILYLALWRAGRGPADMIESVAELEIPDWTGFGLLVAMLSVGWALMLSLAPFLALSVSLSGSLWYGACRRLARTERPELSDDGITIGRGRRKRWLAWGDTLVIEEPVLVALADGRRKHSRLHLVSMVTSEEAVLEPDQIDDELYLQISRHIHRDRWVDHRAPVRDQATP